jgi:hypothetical protein
MMKLFRYRQMESICKRVFEIHHIEINLLLPNNYSQTHPGDMHRVAVGSVVNTNMENIEQEIQGGIHFY